MALPEYLLKSTSSGPLAPRRGDALFEGTDYPREWSGFIGQAKAKEQLAVQAASARARGVRLEHTLFASGMHGIGKSTLATMLAANADVGMLSATGKIDAARARTLLSACEDGDVLFIDEIHTLVTGGKASAEWLLPYMTEGKLLTPGGSLEVPNVTIVGATTDVGRLPETLISRFMVKPKLEAYTADEGEQIAQNLAARMHVDTYVPEGAYGDIASAASCNPRDMRSILTGIRDLHLAYGEVDLDKAFEWSGFSRDGLTVVAREMLVLLSAQPTRTASIESIGALLGEPGPLRYHEQLLMRRGLLTVTRTGRQLTDAGVLRALDAINNQEV